MRLVKNKRAQEEIVGFALIIIIVAIIMLFLLSFSLRKDQKESIESYEVDSFIQAFLQYTSDCRDDFGNLSIQDLIIDCNDNMVCLDGKEACEVLNSTLKEIVDESWKTGQGSPVKGYELKIVANNREILAFEKGNITNNGKGALQDFAKGSNSIEVTFKAYY